MTDKLQQAIKSFKKKQKGLIKEAAQLDHDAEIEILDYLKVWVKEADLNHAKIEAQEVFIHCRAFFNESPLSLFKRWIGGCLENYEVELGIIKNNGFIFEADAGELLITVQKEVPKVRIGRTNKSGYQYFFDLENDKEFQAELKAAEALEDDYEIGLLELMSGYMHYEIYMDFVDVYVIEKYNYCYNFLGYKMNDFETKERNKGADFNEYVIDRHLADLADFPLEFKLEYCI